MTASRSAPHPVRIRAFFYLFLNVFFWSIGPLFIKHFARYYDVWTQNAFRYSCAALMLLAWMAWRGKPSLRLNRAQWGKLLAVAAPNVLLQVLFAMSYYYIYPAVASLVMRVDILIICVLSFAFFHDERGVIRSPLFLAGTGLALPGLLVVLWGQDPELLARLEVSARDFWVGVALVLGYAFFLAVYALAIKRLVRDVHPLVSFTHVSWITSVVLIVLMFLLGNPADLWRGPAAPLGWMAFSALCCIVVAHTGMYAALREIKAVVSTTLRLLTPVFTCAFSAIVHSDRLSGVQIAGGVAVLAGVWLAGMAQVRIGGIPVQEEGG